MTAGDSAAGGTDALAQTLALLASAAANVSLVRVHRSIRDAETLRGFVMGFSPAWTLLARLYDAELDGYVAIRTPDIDRVTITVSRTPFEVRALRSVGDWPPAPPLGVSLGSLREVLSSASANAPLVHIEMEEQDPDAANIGRVVGVDDDEVSILEIDAEAEWENEPTPFRLAEITRVEFGARYEAALHRVGGDPPATR